MTIQENVKHVGFIQHVIAVKDDQFITSADDQTIVLWQIKKQRYDPRQRAIEFQHCFRGHQYNITALTASRTYCVVVSGDASGLLMMWDINRKCHFKSIQVFSNKPIKHIAIHHKMGDVLVASENEMCLLSINGDFLCTKMEKENTMSIMSLNEKSSHLAAESFNGTLNNMRDGQIELVKSSRITCLAWDNRKDDLIDCLILTGHEDKTFKVGLIYRYLYQIQNRTLTLYSTGMIRCGLFRQLRKKDHIKMRGSWWRD